MVIRFHRSSMSFACARFATGMVSLLGVAGMSESVAQTIPPLIYVPLSQPCRLVDTRTSTGGTGPLTAAHGAYLFGTTTADISSSTQHGNSTGCGIPSGVQAVSINMNMIDPTLAGNITTWSADAGTTAPNIGTGVYNPSATFNTGYTSVPVGAANGRFYLQVANGQIDMTVNVVGYWLLSPVQQGRLGSTSLVSGLGNTAYGLFTTAMGENTFAQGNYSTTMGYGTQAVGQASTAMGYQTLAGGADSFTAGYWSTTNGPSSVAMGYYSEADGNSSVALGYRNLAGGDYSVALGACAQTGTNKGSFIFVDDSGVQSGGCQFMTTTTGDNSFEVYADGGVQFAVGTSTCTLSSGTSGWSCSSDRNLKTDIVPVDARAMLEKVTAMPVSTWAFKTTPEYRHIGPMAQDFKTTFGLGDADDKHISTMDAQGVALAAIQGLNLRLSDKLVEKDREIASLREEINALRSGVAKQDARIASLESIANDVVEMKTQLAARKRFPQSQRAPSPSGLHCGGQPFAFQ